MSRETPSALDQAAHWPVRFKKGHVIYDEGEPSEAMYRVESGCVRLQVNGLDGSRQIVRFLFSGDLFGICLDFRNTAAEAASNVELTRYSLKSILDLSAICCNVAIELMNNSTQSYCELAHHVERLSHLQATERVSWFVNLILKKGMNGIDGYPAKLPMSHRDVADYLGLSPETLSRSLKLLQDRGQIPKNNQVALPQLDYAA